MARRGRLVPFDGPAEPGDYITTNLTFKHGDEVFASAKEEVIRIRPVLSFRDGKIEKFDELMAGVRGGETRQGEAQLSDDAPNDALRGQKVTAIFKVLEVKKLEVPELTPELLDELGGFRERRPSCATPFATSSAGSWNTSSTPRPRADHRGADGGRQLGVAAGPVAAAEPSRVAAGGDGVAAERLQRRRNPCPRERPAAKQHGLDRPGPEGAFHPGTDRRRGGDRAGEEDYDAEIRLLASQSERVAAAGAGAVGKERLDGRAAKPNRRAEGDRADPRSMPPSRKSPYQVRRTDEAAIDQAAGGGEHADIPEAKYDEGEEVPEAEESGESEGGRGKRRVGRRSGARQLATVHCGNRT